MVSETDIANRAIQHCGGTRIDTANFTLWTEDSKNASEIRACYHIVRRAEQRRNVWRYSIRTIALRAIDTDTKLVTFGNWAGGTTYAVNDVVMGSDGNVYSSKVGANIGNDPTASYQFWTLYFGALTAIEYITTYSATVTYNTGDHSVGSNGTTYISISDANINHDPVSDGGIHWAVTTDGAVATTLSFYSGELVHIGQDVYLSKQNTNTALPSVTASWLKMTTAPTVAALNFIYPIGAGPSLQTTNKNAYRLPNGFLREAPQDPKAGSVHFLGAPSALPYSDWNFESDFFTSRDSGVITFRFAADISDPSKFDALFIEGFAARLASEVCEPITQSVSKLDEILKVYNVHMTDARLVNGIETGATEPPEDDYVSCRL